MSAVLADIVSGEYSVGDALPNEHDLAQAHEVSRYVARECIHALRDRGVIVVKHGVGSRIAPQDEWQLFDATLLGALLASSAGREALRELRECREVLWPAVAAIAARRRTKRDVARLEAAIDDRAAFESALLATARNRFLRAALAAFERGLHVAAVHAPGDDRGALEGVLAAVRDGDPEAARAAMSSRFSSPST